MPGDKKIHYYFVINLLLVYYYYLILILLLLFYYYSILLFPNEKTSIQLSAIGDNIKHAKHISIL